MLYLEFVYELFTSLYVLLVAIHLKIFKLLCLDILSYAINLSHLKLSLETEKMIYIYTINLHYFKQFHLRLLHCKDFFFVKG